MKYIKYEISSIDDILEIPFERLPVFLDDFRALIMELKGMLSLRENDGIRYPIVWVDDGKSKINGCLKSE